MLLRIVSREKKHILQNHTDIFSQRTQVILLDVNAINHDGAPVDLIKPIEQIDYRRFSRTGCSNQGNRFSGFDIEVDIFQNIVSIVVRKPDVIKFYVALYMLGFRVPFS